MKFNMPLSETDSDSQRKLLEEIYTTQVDGRNVIDTKSVHLCMQIFVKTFAAELCRAYNLNSLI